MSIQALLSEKNISKYRLWKMSGVPQATISDICTGKTKIEKCSAETIYRLAKALDIPMECLVAPAIEALDAERNRPSFELFRSNTCHRVKLLGDIPFLIEVLQTDEIRTYYKKGWHAEALYLLAMVDYLSRENQIPQVKNYDDLRSGKLNRKIFPSSAMLLDHLDGTDKHTEKCLQNAIPEFLRFNIVECEVRNVC